MQTDSGVEFFSWEEYAKAQGYEADFEEGRFHHEIYLSDVRRTKAEKLKTVIRQPVRRIS